MGRPRRSGERESSRGLTREERSPRALSVSEIATILNVAEPTPEGEGAASFEVESICLDDRSFDGELFVAIRGTHYDTHRSLSRLAGTAVRAVVAESAPPPGCDLPWFQVADSRCALGLLEQARWGNPGGALETFGITGTNGKSSTVRILSSILTAAGRSCGWWTTVDHSLCQAAEPCSMTTPGPGELAAAMARCRSNGGNSMVLEVSSHALDQARVAGIPFAGVALTQLSRDHLDYHGNLRAYRDAKLRLAAHRQPGAPCVLPVTEEFRVDLEGLDAPLFRHSLDPKALRDEPGGTVLSSTFDSAGIRAQLSLLGETVAIESTLYGPHNLENLLVAATLARAAGVPLGAIVEGIAKARSVAGRLEEIEGGSGRIFVDYAHTPDALDAVLKSVRQWAKGRLIVVFGCGGDRDRGKRPEMGAAAARHAQRVIVTSDNPRSEAPETIIGDILEGIADPGTGVTVQPDRRAAIAEALAELTPKDVLIVAGKGHESEQIIGDVRLPFDDRSVIASLLGGGRR